MIISRRQRERRHRYEGHSSDSRSSLSPSPSPTRSSPRHAVVGRRERRDRDTVRDTADIDERLERERPSDHDRRMHDDVKEKSRQQDSRRRHRVSSPPPPRSQSPRTSR